MNLLDQVKLCKEMGLVFDTITYSGKVRMKYNEYSQYFIINRSYSKKQLIELLDIYKIKMVIRNIKDFEYNKQRRVRALRQRMKVVNGGLNWCPIGIKIGQATGKLKLVAA